MTTSAFYELAMSDVLDRWRLSIVSDAGGERGLRYGWMDLAWARHVPVVPPLQLIVEKCGERADVSFVRAAIPVLSSRAAEIVRSLTTASEIELIPAQIAGETAEYFVLNVLSVVRCLDEQKTRYVRKWTKDSIRPDRAGDYRTLLGVVIDPSVAQGHNLFRLGGSLVELIASQSIKEAFDSDGLTGVSFRDVCS
jgi:hypothetical protein